MTGLLDAYFITRFVNMKTHSKKKTGACFYQKQAPVFQSGEDGARTHDLLTASQVLSQLSYFPGMPNS